MKRYIIYIWLALQGFILHAESIDSLFTRVPTDLLPLLERNARLDLLDLYNYGMTAKAENLYEGTSHLLVKQKDFLHLQLTDISTWSLKRLVTGNDTLLCCIHTLTRPAIASSIRFYDPQWQTVDIDMPKPADSLFWQPADSLSHERLAELRTRIDFSAVTAFWSADSTELTLRISIVDLNEEDRRDAQQCLRPVTYVWCDQKFVLK